jgi:glycosyltransferase involved in cell wall biosynthesis
VGRPSISVVIPVRNGEPLLRDAVESVYQQTAVPDELIVVDNGSTDGTSRLLQDLAITHPITVITMANSGEAAARNAGVERATGDLVAFLDHDDVWHADKLERQLGQLEADPSLGMSFTGVRRVSEAISETMVQSDWDPEPTVALQRFLAGVRVSTPSAVLVRREAVAAARFDTDIRPYGCDWLMWLTLAARGTRIGHIPEALVDYRHHGGNLSRQASYGETACRVIERFFEQDHDAGDGRFWRAHWHLLAAEQGAGRSHLLKAAWVHPRSVRPGWLRIAVKGSA